MPAHAEPVPQKKIGYAIVGLGQLTLEEVMPAFARCEHSRPVALVSGHRDKALPVARQYGIAEDHVLDYEHFGDLRGLDDVDVVYIVLPNHLHAEYTLKAFDAGKHVLCEKPMAVTPEECERMMAAARAADRQLMIAYRLHYEPFNQRMAALCAEQALGAVKTIMASNCQITQAPDIRLEADKGGGPVSDTGIYCINACRMVTGEEPASVVALAHQPKDNPDFAEVPESVAFLLRYPSGVIAHCETSFGAAESRHLRVHCVDGFIDLEAAFSYQGQQLRLRRGSPTSGPASTEELLLKPVDHFAAEMDHFSACVRDNQPPRTGGDMGLADVRIIEAVRRSVEEGRVVAL